MKPIYTIERLSNGMKCDFYRCGNCNSFIANEEEEEIPNYCSNCGEKVDKD